MSLLRMFVIFLRVRSGLLLHIFYMLPRIVYIGSICFELKSHRQHPSPTHELRNERKTYRRLAITRQLLLPVPLPLLLLLQLVVLVMIYLLFPFFWVLILVITSAAFLSLTGEQAWRKMQTRTLTVVRLAEGTAGGRGVVWAEGCAAAAESEEGRGVAGAGETGDSGG